MQASLPEDAGLQTMQQPGAVGRSPNRWLSPVQIACKESTPVAVPEIEWVAEKWNAAKEAQLPERLECC